MTRQQAALSWVLGSAALMVLGSFGPWVKALGTSVSGTDGGNDGWIVVGAAVIGAALFYRKREVSVSGIWPLIGGALGALVTIYDRNSIGDAINEGGPLAEAIAQVGWGLNLAMVASISFAVAGLVWWRKHELVFSAEATSASPVSAPAAVPADSTAGVAPAAVQQETTAAEDAVEPSWPPAEQEAPVEPEAPAGPERPDTPAAPAPPS